MLIDVLGVCQTINLSNILFSDCIGVDHAMLCGWCHCGLGLSGTQAVEPTLIITQAALAAEGSQICKQHSFLISPTI